MTDAADHEQAVADFDASESRFVKARKRVLLCTATAIVVLFLHDASLWTHAPSFVVSVTVSIVSSWYFFGRMFRELGVMKLAIARMDACLEESRRERVRELRP